MSSRSSAGPTGAEAVSEWRQQVLEKVFVYMFWLLASILMIESILSLRTGAWHGLPGLAVGTVLQGAAAFARNWPIRFRAALFTAAGLFGVGITLPALGFALPLPFVVAAMTVTLLALCVGRAFALTSLILLVVVVLTEGLYVSFYRDSALPALVHAQEVLDPHRFQNWLRVAAVFGAVCFAIIGSVEFLVRRLEEAVQHNGSLFVGLEQASREKIQALEEQRVLEQKVHRSSELQLVGLLAATVAHDFNNLLMVILGNASALKTEVSGEARQDVADIEHAGQQAADLCRRLLTLAGERISGLESADLNSVIEAELPILRRLVTTRVTIDWSPGPALCIKCARTEMRQALLNLCANARDAMPRGGRLRIATDSVERAAPGKDLIATFARLTIEDDGTGMDAATRAKIFEPFFTTKGASHGTGLGMVVVSQAVESQDGFLELESELGRGTTFSLFFPLVSPSQASHRPTSIAPRSARRETILVVDDDEGARKVLTRYLQNHGFAVICATDGQEAIEILRGERQVDLVISDAVMPRMGGRELFDVVATDRPGLPFLFCSGFPAGTLPPAFLESPHRALLSKPFSESELLERIEKLLPPTT